MIDSIYSIEKHIIGISHMAKLKKVAISQSNFIPWKGYFDMIALVDEFVIFDEMQYTRRDWRNRNKIKTPQGTQWITVPVEVKGKYHQKINETKIADPLWGKKAWRTIEVNYKKAKYFEDFAGKFRGIIENPYEYLSDLNFKLIQEICSLLEIKTKFHFSKDFDLREDPTQRLLGICQDLEADIYISGPAAKDYMNLEIFKAQNIVVEWMDYSDYREYSQLYGEFDHYVSILDLIFNEGIYSKDYLKNLA